MTKIDIFSGFLGAGKTTLIKKLIKESYAGEKVVLIENEFGEIGVDGGFLQEAGIAVTEMNSGCICCSLVGDFSKALKEVQTKYAPDRIIIEPSGVGKLSDVVKAVESAHLESATLNAFCTVVDASKCKMYMKNFGEFFNDQVQNAGCIILSHTAKMSEEKLADAVALLREKNPTATLITADWDSLSGKDILQTMERKNSLQADLDSLKKEMHHDHAHFCCGHDHDHHHDHDCCGHDHAHHHGHDCCEHDHDHHHGHDCCEHDHAHHHGHDCCEHDHAHHHVHDCCEHDHAHHHHHDHHADEVFVSWGVETTKKFNKEGLTLALKALEDEHTYGTILRAKGIVDGENGWLHFDYVPGEADVREGSAGVIGRLCIIGCHLQEENLKKLFGV